MPRLNTSNYNRANDMVAVWQPTPKTADVTVTQITGYVRSRPHSPESVIFPYFWHS